MMSKEVYLGEGLVRGLAELYSYIELQERERLFPKPRLPWKTMTPTERIVHKMMFEAHAHILDSGSAYGRHWERRRSQGDLRQLPKAYWYVYKDGDVTFYVDLFHYLVDNFVWVRKLDLDLHRFANLPEWKREAWSDVLEAWFNERGYEVLDHGLTYNNEYHVLNQDFWFLIFTTDTENDYSEWFYAEPDEPVYIIIRTHNGCDIRGGYSAPHIFKVKEEEWGRVLFNYMEEARAVCTGDHEDYEDGVWDFYENRWHDISGDEVDIREIWEGDPERDKVYHKDCGGEVKIYAAWE